MEQPQPPDSAPDDGQEPYRKRQQRQAAQRRQVGNLQPRHVQPTTLRTAFGPDHRPPSGKHSQGRERGGIWRGTSRVVDRAAKNRANKASWAKLLRRDRPTLAGDVEAES